jgi:hypothetical protein
VFLDLGVFKMNGYSIGATDGGWIDLYKLDRCCKLTAIGEHGEVYLDKEQCLDLAHKLMLVAERLQEEWYGR